MEEAERDTVKLSSEERELFAWGASSAMVGLLLFVLRLRLEGLPLGLPLDDAWIHCAFASHLARFGQWGLFAGVPSGGESSPFWPWMLAPGELGGMRQAPRLALLWGSLFFMALPGLGAMLASTPVRRRALALALGLCGPLLFHALSGMETLPALTLGLAALWRMRRGELRSAALFAGAACWMRPDAWLLLIWILLVGSRLLKTEPGRRSIWPGSFGLWAPGAVLGALALLTLSAAEASFPPTTLAGRRWLMGLPPGLDLASLGQGAGQFGLEWLRALGADFGLGRVVHAHPSSLAQLARTGWKLALVVSLLHGVRQVLRHDTHGERRAMRLLMLWTGTVILFYALVLPTRGHVGRYQVMLYPLLFLLVVEGVGAFGAYAWTRRWLPALLALPLGLGLLAGCVESSVLWGDAIRHIDRVHLQAAGELERGLPEGTVLGVFDVGAVAYVYEGEMIDLSGLSDPLLSRTLPHAREGAMAALLWRRGMDEVMLPVLNDENELEFATRLGLLGGDPRQPTFGRGARLVEVGRWGSPVEEWGPAFHFSGNAFRELRLYRWELPR